MSSPLPALAALGLGAAALLLALALARGRSFMPTAARVLAALAAAALLPATTDPAARPLVALAVAAVLVPRPLALLLGSAGGLLLGLRSGPAPAPAALVVVAAAAVLAAAAVSSSIESRLAAGGDAAWSAAAGGAALALALAFADDGRILRWGYAVGSGDSRVEIPGAGLLLGLALLATLAGTLLLGAHLLAAPQGAALGRLTGQRLLLLAAGLAVLGLGFAVAKGVSLHEAALAASGGRVAALYAAAFALILGLVVLLEGTGPNDAARLASRAETETRMAAVLSVLAAGAAGLEGWLREGSYGTPLMAGSVAASLLGLAALQATRFATLRRGLLLAGLLSLLSPLG